MQIERINRGITEVFIAATGFAYMSFWIEKR
jgi:hypothetical protein